MRHGERSACELGSQCFALLQVQLIIGSHFSQRSGICRCISVEKVAFFCNTTAHSRVLRFATTSSRVLNAVFDGQYDPGCTSDCAPTDFTSADGTSLSALITPQRASIVSHETHNSLSNSRRSILDFTFPFGRALGFHHSEHLGRWRDNYMMRQFSTIATRCSVGEHSDTTHQIWAKIPSHSPLSVCDASATIENGALGDCTSTLSAGSSCAPVCDAGFELTGSRSCDASGTLSDTAKCAPTSPSGRTVRLGADIHILHYSFDRRVVHEQSR